MKKPKIWAYFMNFLKSYGINEKKYIFLFFSNYLKTETKKNSEKNL